MEELVDTIAGINRKETEEREEYVEEAYEDGEEKKGSPDRNRGSSDEDRANRSANKKDKTRNKESGDKSPNRGKKPQRPNIKQEFVEDQVKESGSNMDGLEYLEESLKKKERKTGKMKGTLKENEGSLEDLNENYNEIGDKNITMGIKQSIIERKENSEEYEEELRDPNNKAPSYNVTEGEILQQLGMISKNNIIKPSENPEYEKSSEFKALKNPKSRSPAFKKTTPGPEKPAKQRKNSDPAIKVSNSFKSKENFDQKLTFGDEFPNINPSDLKPKRQSSNSSKNSSSNRDNKKEFVTNLFSNVEETLQSGDRSNPETPNLASPVKPAKPKKDTKKIKSPDSAVWTSQQDEILRLRQQVKDFEAIIEKQAQEILELKKNQAWNEKKNTSPKSSGFIQGRAAGTFLQKNPEMLKKDDLDFWKIPDEAPNSREPQKLEDIAALKDLWILNMESGNQLSSNLSGKKPPGIKANPLTKYESNRSANIRNRFLPKIATKKDLSK